ncbi:MAG: hypothetical protein C4K60_04910 [Ideonella sp. MAG2]|nr:MAG: hypothetical protein C4K60_04910 [Ideonella sp. MAG2]
MRSAAQRAQAGSARHRAVVLLGCVALLALATVWVTLGSAEAPRSGAPTTLAGSVLLPLQAAPLLLAASASHAAQYTLPMPARPTPSSANAPRPAAPAISQDLADHVPSGPAPSMAEVIQRLNQAGIHSGLGAFNPPGTRPPLIGLAVPEAFELPPGFVRHHQATDDGQRIEAVLMFAPDHPYVLAHPELSSRVVPAELAPEGLPLRTISLPPPRRPTP